MVAYSGENDDYTLDIEDLHFVQKVSCYYVGVFFLFPRFVFLVFVREKKRTFRNAAPVTVATSAIHLALDMGNSPLPSLHSFCTAVSLVCASTVVMLVLADDGR